MTALILQWSLKPRALNLGWHDLIKAGPMVLEEALDPRRLATIIAVASASLGAKKYYHQQVSAQPTWIIPHNLNSPPTIVIMDMSGNVIEANIIHLDANVAQIDFSIAFAGNAYLYA